MKNLDDLNCDQILASLTSNKMMKNPLLELIVTINFFKCTIFYLPIYYDKDKQDSRDSSPKPSSDMLDSLCPNCSEHLSRASQPSISAILKNAQQCSTMFKNALKHSDMLINAQ